MTVTAVQTLRGSVDQANPSNLADRFRDMQLGTMMDPITRTITITPGTAVNLVTAGQPPFRVVHSIRVTVGTNTLPVVAFEDAAGAAALVGATAQTVTLSDNGDVIGFSANVTTIVVRYSPRSAADMASTVNLTSP